MKISNFSALQNNFVNKLNIPSKMATSVMNAGDVVSFTSSKEIFKRNGINPNEVAVKSDQPIDNKTKLELIEKVLEAHEHAVKNKTLGNYSGRCFATNMKLNSGVWSVATNIEITTETVLCGERSGLVRSWNTHLQNMPVVTDENKDTIKYSLAPKVEVLAMSSYAKPSEQSSSGNPCSECLNWINTKRYFSADTKIATLAKDPDTDKLVLTVRPVTAVLPYWGTEAPSKTDKKISDLALDITDRAETAIKAHDISLEKIYESLQVAKKAYKQGVTSELSENHNVGASALMDPGDVIMPGERMEWTRRWMMGPELLASTNGFQTLTKAIMAARNGVQTISQVTKGLPEGTNVMHFLKELSEQKQGEARINAVAYYGDDAVPYLANLGMISQGRGGADTLVLSIKDDKVQVRTILDYMPHLYISSKKK